jgi:CRP/FNR family transcriptional regulator, cyclic AMP receptor protein
MDAVSTLRDSPLFKGFTETGLTIIAGICHQRSFPHGTPLFVENMMADSLLIIGDGNVSLGTKGRRQEDIHLGELGVGDWLGELSLINTGQRMCTAIAVTPVIAYEIRQGDFQKLLALKPQACIKLLMAIVSTFGQKVVDNKDALRSLLTK